MALTAADLASLKVGDPCEHCGAALDADGRTLTKRCGACGMLSRTERHPSLAEPGRPLLEGARPTTTPSREPAVRQPPAPPASREVRPMSSYPHLDALAATYGRNPVSTPTVAIANQVDDAIAAAGGHPAQVRKNLRVAGLSADQAEAQLAKMARVEPQAIAPVSPAASSSSAIDAAIRKVGGDPKKVRASLAMAGLTSEQIDARLAAMAAR
jgi:hypothetical protein